MGATWSTSPCRISVGTSISFRSSVISVSENALIAKYAAEGFHHLGEIVGVGVHVIALPRLAGAAMTSTIMSDTAVALSRQEEHLVFKSVAVQRIRMVKNDGLSFPPIFKVEFCAVFGGDSAHWFLFIGFVSIAAPALAERVD